MKFKTARFLKRFAYKNLVNLLLVAALIVAMVPPMAASGVSFTANDDNGNVTVTSNIGSYFYRIPFNADGTASPITNSSTFAYGYGYGYNSSTATYSYGYGYGYGYGYFATTGTSWVQGDPGLGFFLGTGGATTSATLPVTAGGVATVAVATTLTTSGLAGVSVLLPANLVITGSAGWDGSLTATGTSTYSSVPSTIKSLFDSGSTVASVTIATGLSVRVTLSDEIIIKIPFTGTPGLVKIVDGAGTVTTVTACSGTEYTGASTSAANLVDSGQYSLAAAGVCYVVGTGAAAGNIYVATRHLSSVAAGTAATSTTTTTTSSGGGSVGGYKTSKGAKKIAVETDEDKKEEDEDEKDEEKDPGEIITEPVDISELTDLTGIPTDDWRYTVANRVLKAGLFKGEKDKDGKMVFNGQNGMNRAMAAVVVCRYVGCDLGSMTGNPFADVPASEWYGPSVGALKGMGIVKGKADGKFDPGSQVTRAEFFKMLVEAYIVNNSDVKVSWQALLAMSATAFKDVGAKDWYTGYFHLGYEMKLISGYDVAGKKEARPNNAVSRFEAAAMLTNFLDNIE